MNKEIELSIDKYGNKYYVLKNNTLNLSNNLEFVTIKDNSYYYNRKLIHRKNGPAIEYSNGDKEWYQNGKLHRESGPAVEDFSGYKEWYQNGILHRKGGPAIEYVNGKKEWYVDSKKHREDGPAIEGIGVKKEYYINGVEISEENFYLEKELRESINNNNISKKKKI